MTSVPLRRRLVPLAALAVIAAMLAPGSPTHADDGYRTSKPPFLRIEPTAPEGTLLRAIINSGEELDGFTFEGIPDGIGIAPGNAPGTIRTFVAHEQSHVPFQGQADFEDASISQLMIDTETAGVLDAKVALPPREGFIRFCSSFMAGPEQGFSDYTFFANEESNDIIPVPENAPYGPDPAVAPNRQAGYAVALNVETGRYDEVASMGRHNHENTVFVPGPWGGLTAISGDDTFNAPSSQLYMWRGSEAALWADEGTLLGFRVTATDEGPVDPEDPFNSANDYGDIRVGDTWKGEFIKVPRRIALGNTQSPPQTALENWSNRNNIFQFIRVEDTAYDVNDPLVHYIADTGERRAIPSATTGRLARGPSGTTGPYPNGRIFKMVFSPDDPRVVEEFSILLDNDAGGYDNPAVMHAPDNMDTSVNSLMVQEDSSQPPNSRVWRYDLATETWTVVASVREPAWESSGIVDASAWFGPGFWLLDVQAHGDFVDSFVREDGVLLKREAGQLLVMKVPGS